MGDERGDPLAALNDELRNLDAAASEWLPLESNPEVFEAFAHRAGAPHLRCCDVLGFDPELLGMIPGIPVALILLFPCSNEIYAFRRREEKALLQRQETGPRIAEDRGIFFVRQVAAFGNACGSMACVHALANAPLPLTAGAPLTRFLAENADASPDERGEALVRDCELKEPSDRAAVVEAAQTRCPPRGGAPLDHHFVAITHRDGRLIELDGTKAGPIDHGPCAPAAFISEAAALVQRNWVNVTSSVEFSMCALHTE